MKKVVVSRFLLTVTAFGLVACAPLDKKQEDGAQYWARVSSSSAAYLDGPKAQQMLQRDIGHCVAELQELERIGVVKEAIPTSSNGRTLDPDKQKIEDFEVPDRDGYLLMEHRGYDDMENCMIAKGWERRKYAPYEKSRNATMDYYETLHKDSRAVRQRKRRTSKTRESFDVNGGYDDYMVND